MMKKSLGLILLTLFLAGCAQMHSMFGYDYCSTYSAYNTGVSDGQAGAMQSDYAASCPSDHAKLNKSYMKGYRHGVETRPDDITLNPQQYPHTGSYTAPQNRGAYQPPRDTRPTVPVHTAESRQCVEKDGKNTCGYDCQTDTFGKTICAKNRYQNCVKTDFEVKCGNNCRVDRFNQIKCDG